MIVACQKGLRSLAACEQLARAGYGQLAWINGGMDASKKGDIDTDNGVDVRCVPRCLPLPCLVGWLGREGFEIGAGWAEKSLRWMWGVRQVLLASFAWFELCAWVCPNEDDQVSATPPPPPPDLTLLACACAGTAASGASVRPSGGLRCSVRSRRPASWVAWRA